MPPADLIDRRGFDQATVLLAEDNRDDALIMKRAFQKAGYLNPVQVVADGEEVLSYLEGREAYADREKFPLPILLFLDLNMPKLSGFEVLERIQRRPDLRRMPIYVLTASGRSIDVVAAFASGASGYLIKPTKLDELIEMLRSLRLFAGHQVFPK